MRRFKGYSVIIPISQRAISISFISFDPGSKCVGWSLFSVFIKGNRIRWWLLTSSHVNIKGRKNIYERIGQIDRQLSRDVPFKGLKVSIIELLFVAKNWSTTLTLAYSRGLLIYIANKWSEFNLDYSSNSVRRFFSNHWKEELHYLLRVHLGIRISSPDQGDAIAIGLSYLGMELLGETRFLNATDYLRGTNIN